MPIGLLTGRLQAGENDPREAPFLMFRRDADGALTLLGYAYPSRDGMLTYAFAAAAGPSPARARAKQVSSAAPPVLIFAQLD